MSKRGIPKEGGIFACQKMSKKKQDQFLLSNSFNVYSIEVLGHFDAWRPEIVFETFYPKIFIKNI